MLKVILRELKAFAIFLGQGIIACALFFGPLLYYVWNI
jgi:hypothetical protein